MQRDGETLYISGRVQSDNDLPTRSDVLFAQRGPIITPLSAEARVTSSLTDMRDALGVSFIDPTATAAIFCARQVR